MNTETPPTLTTPEFSSSITTYKVMVNANGVDMRWYATKVKNQQAHYVSEIWCADNYTDEYRKLKKSVKKKIRKMVREAVGSMV